MIIQNDAGVGSFVPAIDKLYDECFDGLRFSESDPAELRSFFFNTAKTLCSHAAIKRCRYDFINAPRATTWILGYVCTPRALRGRGYASHCLGELFEALRRLGAPWIMILNCKPDRVPFYEKNGFETIAEKASYDRKEGVTIDDDPVMAKCSTPELMATIAKGPVLHLGEEF